MKLCVITSVFNEEDLLPQFLRHYRAQGVGEFNILDNHCTDGSIPYLKTQKDVNVLCKYGFVDQMDDTKKLEMLEGFKKAQAYMDASTYCILADCDEFIEPIAENHTIKSYIEQYPHEIYGSIGYNMVQHKDDKPYDPGKPLTEQRQHGFHFESYDKPIVVKASFPCRYSPGMHTVEDERRLLHPEKDFVLLHYVAFDREISLKRRYRQAERTKEVNLQYGHGAENAGKDAGYWDEWLENHWNDPNIVKVI
jgi:hypothetical protein